MRNSVTPNMKHNLYLRSVESLSPHPSSSTCDECTQMQVLAFVDPLVRPCAFSLAFTEPPRRPSCLTKLTDGFPAGYPASVVSIPLACQSSAAACLPSVVRHALFLSPLDGCVW